MNFYAISDTFWKALPSGNIGWSVTQYMLISKGCHLSHVGILAHGLPALMASRRYSRRDLYSTGHGR